MKTCIFTTLTFRFLDGDCGSGRLRTHSRGVAHIGSHLHSPRDRPRAVAIDQIPGVACLGSQLESEAQVVRDDVVSDQCRSLNPSSGSRSDAITSRTTDRVPFDQDAVANEDSVPTAPKDRVAGDHRICTGLDTGAPVCESHAILYDAVCGDSNTLETGLVCRDSLDPVERSQCANAESAHTRDVSVVDGETGVGASIDSASASRGRAGRGRRGTDSRPANVKPIEIDGDVGRG